VPAWRTRLSTPRCGAGTPRHQAVERAGGADGVPMLLAFNLARPPREAVTRPTALARGGEGTPEVQAPDTGGRGRSSAFGARGSPPRSMAARTYTRWAYPRKPRRPRAEAVARVCQPELADILGAARRRTFPSLSESGATGRPTSNGTYAELPLREYRTGAGAVGGSGGGGTIRAARPSQFRRRYPSGGRGSGSHEPVERAAAPFMRAEVTPPETGATPKKPRRPPRRGRALLGDARPPGRWPGYARGRGRSTPSEAQTADGMHRLCDPRAGRSSG